MKIKCRKSLLFIPVVALLYFASPGSACGPFFPETIFRIRKHPDLPLQHFANGQLGILDPSYSMSYLYVAYRSLSGKGLDPADQAAVVSLWRTQMSSPFGGDPGNGERTKTPVQEWLEARSRVPGVGAAAFVNNADPVGIARRVPGAAFYEMYYDCLGEAFLTARATLQSRIQQFGASSAQVGDWVKAQDAVFANCEDRSSGPGPVLPPPPKPVDIALVQEDRAYQTAAAYFYSGDLGTARAKFDEISRDENSPWRDIASLVAVRALIRQSTLKRDQNALPEAEKQLHDFLSRSDSAALRPAAERLLGWVEFRLHPLERAHILAQKLTTGSDPNLAQDLLDYTLLLRNLVEVSAVAAPPRVKAQQTDELGSLNDLRRSDDLTDWILAFQNSDSASQAHSLEKWRPESSLPWLVTSIVKAQANDASTPALLAAAARVLPQSPAFATVSFHRLRLLIESGKSDEARTELDKILSRDRGILPPSSLNQFLALRMHLARNLDEFLRFAPRVPAVVTDSSDTYEVGAGESDFVWSEQWKSYWKDLSSGKPRLDVDSVVGLTEHMPTEMLVQAARSEILPPHLRAEVVASAWVRAILLNDEQDARELAPLVSELIPELKPPMNSYLGAAHSESRKLAAILTLLRFPGLHPYVRGGPPRESAMGEIDEYRDNWWCGFQKPSDMSDWEWRDYLFYLATDTQYPRAPYPGWKPAPPNFLGASDQHEAVAQMEALKRIATAPTYLSQQVLSWAKAHPEDPRVPEALYLAVRSTRYGCTDKETSKYSKEAFLLLHRRYPRSEWAKKTRYWF